jgi:hypothetical protein
VNIFQSIFGGRDETRGKYPESLVEQAIERAVDGTDARIRLLPGYQKRLRGPVICAIDHVIPLVDGLPAPLTAGHSEFTSEPVLSALFASAGDMLGCFSRDHSLVSYLESSEGRGAERITALLLADRENRTTLGIDLHGDQLRRDVPQVTVGFSDHNVLDPRDSESEARRQLKRRAFDQLLTMALARIGEARIERADLTRQRDLLRVKLAALKRGGWDFESHADEAPAAVDLHQQLDKINDELAALGRDDQILQTNLEIVADLLEDAEHQIWSEDLSLSIDAMNIERDPDDPSARHLVLKEIKNGQGLSRVMLLVSFSPRDLPKQEDLVTAASRYLY